MKYPNRIKLHDSFVTYRGSYPNVSCDTLDILNTTCFKLSDTPSEKKEPIIREFLAKKDRLNFYEIQLPHMTYYKSLSDDDVAFIKSKFDREYDPDCPKAENRYSSWPPPVYVERLTSLAFEHVLSGEEIVVVDFDHVLHFYAMSKAFCDVKNNQIKKTIGFGVPLTDGEYVYLVDKIITHNHKYFYTDLATDNPSLANKINSFALYGNPHEFCDDVRELPYLISFDELAEDALEIDPPLSAEELEQMIDSLFRIDDGCMEL